MRKTMRESGFKGIFEEFLKFLNTDPQFYAKTPDELMGVSAYVAKRDRREDRRLFRPAAAPAVRDHPGAGRARALLHRRAAAGSKIA